MFGVLLGFGIGFAAAILLAPEKKKEPKPWTPRSPEDERASGRRCRLLKERVNEAMGEARDRPAKHAEREMCERYERTIGRKTDN